ncbi:hypothetical protein [Aporhodopirellula aestuarii]|uniref:Uncharacterized protein n=1 Tax=Aporhodopirellula aestuarii TaxID=2950107 RepID=A0ABT0TXL1_9BACT|nr:hypothetical protein [Aporhodopirellula aestuarii]MCM2369319.1 hypothetical protein [Aporhodopirellula aestuarii]
MTHSSSDTHDRANNISIDGPRVSSTDHPSRTPRWLANWKSIWLILISFQLLFYVGWLAITSTTASQGRLIAFAIGFLFIECAVLSQFAKWLACFPRRDLSSRGRFFKRMVSALVVAGLIACLLTPGLTIASMQESSSVPLFADGPTLGPMKISEVDRTMSSGMIELTNGSPKHDFGAKSVTGNPRKYQRTYFADPLADETWSPERTTTVWVVHRDGEVIDSKDRFAYIVSTRYLHRHFFEFAVAMSIEDFDLTSANDAMIVMLRDGPPVFPDGPTYSQAVLAWCLLVGFLLGPTAYTFGAASGRQ